MALIPEPTVEQQRALDVARSYFASATAAATLHVTTLPLMDSRSLVASEFAQGFHRSFKLCQTVLDVFDAWTPEMPQ
jgi:hypothetical protein